MTHISLKQIQRLHPSSCNNFILQRQISTCVFTHNIKASLDGTWLSLLVVLLFHIFVAPFNRSIFSISNVQE